MIFLGSYQRELTYDLLFVNPSKEELQIEENMQEGLCSSHFLSNNRSNCHATSSSKLSIIHKWNAYKAFDLIPRIVSWYHPLSYL